MTSHPTDDSHPVYYSRPQKLVEADEAIAVENEKARREHAGVVAKRIEVQELPDGWFKKTFDADR